ncbi:MAG: hypothetical protein HKN42_19040 [Granulosicoccus sp.]|nr:hypothetical protein [Granulosicoccus sp.]
MFKRHRYTQDCSIRVIAGRIITSTLVLFGASFISPSLADSLSIGGDTFLSGDSAELSSGSARDAFVAGFSSSLTGEVQGDAHIAGFTASVLAPVAGDVYATGSNVEIAAAVGGDLTAAGFTVRLSKGASLDGNARISGGNLIIESPIDGALLAAAATVRLDASVGGDARITASDIAFGSGAQVAGLLTYSAPKEIAIPESVAPASRVRFVPASASSVFRDLGESVGEPLQNFWPGFASRVMAALLVLGSLVLLAAILFAFAPRQVESMRQRASEHAWFALVFGFVGLSILFGAVPVSLMTLVGIPFALVALLLILIFWTLGYLLGLYVFGTRIWSAFDGSYEKLPAKLVLIAVGLVIAAALNFIPIIGWLVNIVVLFFGLGAITIVILDYLLERTRPTKVNDGKTVQESGMVTG